MGSDSSDTDESDVYEAERIIDRRRTKSGAGWEYKVAWKGYPGQDTWEPAENIIGRGLIEDFDRTLKEKHKARLAELCQKKKSTSHKSDFMSECQAEDEDSNSRAPVIETKKAKPCPASAKNEGQKKHSVKSSSSAHADASSSMKLLNVQDKPSSSKVEATAKKYKDNSSKHGLPTPSDSVTSDKEKKSKHKRIYDRPTKQQQEELETSEKPTAKNKNNDAVMEDISKYCLPELAKIPRRMLNIERDSADLEKLIRKGECEDWMKHIANTYRVRLSEYVSCTAVIGDTIMLAHYLSVVKGDTSFTLTFNSAVDSYPLGSGSLLFASQLFFENRVLRFPVSDDPVISKVILNSKDQDLLFPPLSGFTLNNVKKGQNDVQIELSEVARKQCPFKMIVIGVLLSLCDDKNGGH